MYLHFEDWSDLEQMPKFDEKRSPHVEQLIKVYASDLDPRLILGRTALTVVESNEEVFTPDESYAYRRRRTYTGSELEEDLAGYELGNLGQRTVRSLFRFSARYGFSQAAMAAQYPGSRSRWLLRHPFEEIDGIALTRRNPKRERDIHLDLSFPQSLEDLRQIVDINNPESLLTSREEVSLYKQQIALSDA